MKKIYLKFGKAWGYFNLMVAWETDCPVGMSVACTRD